MSGATGVITLAVPVSNFVYMCSNATCPQPCWYNRTRDATSHRYMEVSDNCDFEIQPPEALGYRREDSTTTRKALYSVYRVYEQGCFKTISSHHHHHHHHHHKHHHKHHHHHHHKHHHKHHHHHHHHRRHHHHHHHHH
eukprot:5568331-Amphidinium_carterae.1